MDRKFIEGAIDEDVDAHLDMQGATQEDELMKIKAAMHFAVGQTCEHFGKKSGCKYTKPFIAALTEVIFSQSELFTKDVEYFAKHAKRSVVNMDDVKLLVRRNSSLLERLNEACEKLTEGAASKKKSKRVKIEDDSEAVDEDFNP